MSNASYFIFINSVVKNYLIHVYHINKVRACGGIVLDVAHMRAARGTVPGEGLARLTMDPQVCH